MVTNMKLIKSAVIAVLWFVAGQKALAADWPMWRSDVRRSGVSSADLPDEMNLRWTRELPKAKPAWPNEPRLHFDASYEPIVSGRRMIVGSPNENRCSCNGDARDVRAANRISLLPSYRYNYIGFRLARTYN